MKAPVWLDGQLIEAEAAQIDPADRGLLLADGLFETIRVDASGPCFLDRHLARLRASAGRLRLPVPLDDAAIRTAMLDLLAAFPGGAGSLRLTLTRGPGPRGLKLPESPTPTLLIRAFPPAPPPPPARLVLSTIRRNEYSPTAGMKTLAYLDQVLAMADAAAAGFDDALFLNTAGDVACTTMANLFAVIAGRPVTPDLAAGILPGITRARVLALPLGAAERPLTLADLLAAEELFVTNALLGARPIVGLGDRTLAIGPVTRAVQAMLDDQGSE